MKVERRASHPQVPPVLTSCSIKSPYFLLFKRISFVKCLISSIGSVLRSAQPRGFSFNRFRRCLLACHSHLGLLLVRLLELLRSLQLLLGCSLGLPSSLLEVLLLKPLGYLLSSQSASGNTL